MPKFYAIRCSYCTFGAGFYSFLFPNSLYITAKVLPLAIADFSTSPRRCAFLSAKLSNALFFGLFIMTSAQDDESTPLLQNRDPGSSGGNGVKSWVRNAFGVENRILLTGFLITLSFSFTQVPYGFPFLLSRLLILQRGILTGITRQHVLRFPSHGM